MDWNSRFLREINLIEARCFEDSTIQYISKGLEEYERP